MKRDSYIGSCLNTILSKGETVYLIKKKCRGNNLIWSIKTKDDEIFISYGTEHGKIQQATKKVSGKNIGRKNETLPKEQAIFDSITLIHKKLDDLYLLKHYVEGCPDDIVSNTEIINLSNKNSKSFRPMLASKLDTQDIKNICFSDVAFQPKLDGMRIISYVSDDNNILMQSRTGKINPNFEYISYELKQFFVENQSLILDGEIYKHNHKFEDIISSTKKHGSLKLDYHVYDVFDKNNPNASFNERFVKRFDGILKLSNYVHIVPIFYITCPEKLNVLFETVIKDNFEGLMCRNIDSSYEPNKRSKNLLKIKKFITEEFLIVNFHDGVGKDCNSVIFECLIDNCTFRVRPAWDIERRKRVYNECVNDFSKYKGKLLSVKYFEKTDDGSIRFPVGIEIRDYE